MFLNCEYKSYILVVGIHIILKYYLKEIQIYLILSIKLRKTSTNSVINNSCSE